MIIESLSLKNIRSYIDETVNFSEGISLLSGEVGSGKSTLLYAIEFALFGIIKGINSYEQLLRHGEDSGFVLLTLLFPSQRKGESVRKIQIERTIKRSKGNKFSSLGAIIRDDIRTDLSSSELKFHVHQLLGYPTQDLAKKFLLFRYTVYTPQEQMKSILEEDKESRLAALRKIFGIDKYKQVIENISMYSKHLYSKIKFLEGTYADLDNKKELAEQLQNKISKLLEEIASQENIIKQLNLDFKKNKLVLSELEKDQAQLHDLIQKKAFLQKQLSDFSKELSQMKELEIQCNNTLFTHKDLLSQLFAKKELFISDLNFFHQYIPSFCDDGINLFSSLTYDSQNLLTLIGVSTYKDLVSSKREAISNYASHYKESFREKEKVAMKLKEEFASLGHKLEELTIQKNSLDRRIIDINTLIDPSITQESLVELKKVILALEEKSIQEKSSQDLYFKKLDALKISLATNKSKISSANLIIREINEIDSCPTCLQSISLDHKNSVVEKQKYTISELNNLIESFQNKITSIENDLSLSKERSLEYDKNISTHKESLALLKSKFSENRNHADQLALLKKDKELLISSYKIKFSEFEQMKKEVSILSKQIPYQKMNDFIISLQEWITEYFHCIEKIHSLFLESTRNNDRKVILIDKEAILNNELVGVFEKMNSFENLQPQIDLLNKNIQSLDQNLKREMMAQASLQRDHSSSLEQLDLLKIEINKKEFAQRKRNSISSLRNWLQEYFVNLMFICEKKIMLKIYHQFNDYFQQWFNILMEHDSLNVMIDEHFTPKILLNGYDADYKHLSGGEKTSIALAYRIALNQILNTLFTTVKTKDLIILDEPTDGFSYQQLDRMKDLLDQIQCAQILLVSHETKIESFVDNIIQVKKENAISSIIS